MLVLDFATKYPRETVVFVESIIFIAFLIYIEKKIFNR
ncbi:hypothetical protein bthur0013_63580 [Bacillus thuringiensis IBL 200]|nr:hypothetical protein bthur0013_63580 [Bacillus thuringiensis IBL 200]